MEVNRQTRRKPMAEINVVPMIDVMLVLLIVFMISTPLITQGIKVDLPKVNAETVEESDEPTLVVSINAAGEYFISLGETSEDNPTPVPLEQIGDNVKKIMSANPKVPVFVEADASIPYGTVMKLGGTLSAAGVAELRFITQPPGVDSDK